MYIPIPFLCIWLFHLFGQRGKSGIWAYSGKGLTCPHPFFCFSVTVWEEHNSYPTGPCTSQRGGHMEQSCLNHQTLAQDAVAWSRATWPSLDQPTPPATPPGVWAIINVLDHLVSCGSKATIIPGNAGVQVWTTVHWGRLGSLHSPVFLVKLSWSRVPSLIWQA